MNDDEYDPDVESFADYCSRTAGQRRVAQKELKKTPDATIGARTAYEIQAALQELLEAQQSSVSVADFIFSLRSVASRLEQEADRLQARDAINFHVCFTNQ